jgi:nucleoside-diphosphate-sugar epimerase
MKRIFITGINGFLGRNITKQMLSRGNIIFGTSQHTSNIKELLPKIEFHGCDLENITSIRSDITKFAPDVIIHCAWWGGNNYSDTNEPNQFHKNLPGTVHIMEILSGIKKNVHFIGVGTAAEYGNQNTGLSELTPESPLNLYGTCKTMVKLYSEQFCKLHNIKWTWIRPFYIYGPGDVQTRLIPRVINACLKKECLTLDSCLSQNDYLYIDDFTTGVYYLIEQKREGIYNICSGELYEVQKIIQLIAHKPQRNSF